MGIDWKREQTYLWRSLCLKALVRDNEKKEYTKAGVAMNIAYFCCLLVLSASITKTLSMNRQNIDTREYTEGRQKIREITVNKYVIYCAVSKLCIPLWIAIVAGTVLYSSMFGFGTLEAWYIVLYSITAMIPMLVVEKGIENLVPDFKRKDKVMSVIYVVKTVMSMVFVNANIEKKPKTKAKKVLSLVLCAVIQTMIVSFSVNLPDLMFVIGKKNILRKKQR